MVLLPKYRVLNFLRDSGFGCALTVLVDDSWYHITADPRRFRDRSKQGKKIASDYRRFMGEAEASDGAADGQGTAPLFIQADQALSESEGGERDSAVDVSTSTEDGGTKDEHHGKPGTALERWMLTPLKETFSRRKRKDQDANRTVQDWYSCPKYYFDLSSKHGRLWAEEDKHPSSSLRKRLEALVPSMPLPKYIRSLEIPFIDAHDLTVLRESPEPAPIHPTRVRHPDGKEYFLKLVDPYQPQPIKREIQVMKRIESAGLQNDLRVPLLRGLVHFSDCPRNHILGFIMDAIDGPTPLTLLIDADVDETKRLAWAAESARMVDVLHQHGIIWGDAKGDNFMVDADDRLWIIDFGGSYTEGWVDPELKETEEGDAMGVRKICNGLEDPEHNTVQEDQEEEAGPEVELGGDDDDGENQSKQRITNEEASKPRGCANSMPQTEEHATKGEKSTPQHGRKRKAVDTVEPVDGEAICRKQRKTDSEADTDELLYCYCKKPSSGRMVACDGKHCNMQWFHFACIGLEEAPKEKKWYCEECLGSQ